MLYQYILYEIQNGLEKVFFLPLNYCTNLVLMWGFTVQLKLKTKQ